jgi:hypothetical protein
LWAAYLGTWFQQRTWDHQNTRTLAEADRSHATEVCRELNQLMDKRLYRMRQLNWALTAEAWDAARVEACVADYRSVLYEWNDSLNRNLAAAEAQFGGALRERLERGIYEGFRAAGVKLEASYRHRRGPSSDADETSGELVARDLNRLRENIYDLALTMLRLIHEGHVGRQVLR